jgi:hypothetical protein
LKNTLQFAKLPVQVLSSAGQAAELAGITGFPGSAGVVRVDGGQGTVEVLAPALT